MSVQRNQTSCRLKNVCMVFGVELFVCAWRARMRGFRQDPIIMLDDFHHLHSSNIIILIIIIIIH